MDFTVGANAKEGERVMKVASAGNRTGGDSGAGKHGDNEEFLSTLPERIRNLKEMNNALRAIVNNRDDQKDALGERVLANTKTLVIPYITKLKETNLDGYQRTLLEIIEMNLHEIISPLLAKLTSLPMGFTPKEIQVATLIRDGKKTREIAKIMKVTKSAVDLHRNHIHTNLALSKRKVNLQSYLALFT